MQKLQQRVEKGAAFLDTRDPRWWQRIDTKTLDLRLAHYCILGQLFGSYMEGTRAFTMSYEQAVSLGFHDAWWAQIFSSRFERLTNAWREVINARRAQVA